MQLYLIIVKLVGAKEDIKNRIQILQSSSI